MVEVCKEQIGRIDTCINPQPLKSGISLPNFPSTVRKAFIFTGMLGSGKTYVMYQRMNDLLREKIDNTKLLLKEK